MDLKSSKYNLFLSAKDFHEAIGRNKELMRITRTLFREMKNNVLLIGNAGVGKKAIIEGLVFSLVNNKASFLDSFIKIEASDILFSYTTKRENFILSLRDQISLLKNAAVFIPDLHILFQDPEIAKVYYPIFQIFEYRKDLRFIGSIDPISYRLVFEKDPFLKGLTEPIRIDEVDAPTAVSIIMQNAKLNGPNRTAKIANLIVTLSKRYIYSSFLPSKAIDILDEARGKITFERKRSITEEDIKEIIADKTGIPIQSISLSDQEKLINIEKYLTAHVVGQPKAIESISEGIRRSRLGMKDPKKPIGSFLFLGGSGVGKTELAKSLADFMYDTESSLIRLDMSEYTESHSLQRLIGAPPGYVGYEEGGQLTNPVWERPYSLILLDEIEKAHPKIFDVFLQVLDEGRLTDGQGKTVNFNNSIIIATSNAGFTEIIDDIIEGKDLWSRTYIDKTLVPILMKSFRLEFLNRFDDIIVFKPLNFNELKEVAKIQLLSLQTRLQEKDITLRVSDEFISQIATAGKNPLF